MKVKGFDGREYHWKLKHKYKDQGSKLHKSVKELLREIYPYDLIHEEVSLPGSGRPSLRADFVIVSQDLVVEVHGKQHFEYNSFHFKDKLSFYKAQARDRRKKDWCELNDLTLVELRYDETREQWNDKLRGAFD